MNEDTIQSKIEALKELTKMYMGDRALPITISPEEYMSAAYKYDPKSTKPKYIESEEPIVEWGDSTYDTTGETTSSKPKTTSGKSSAKKLSIDDIKDKTVKELRDLVKEHKPSIRNVYSKRRSELINALVGVETVGTLDISSDASYKGFTKGKHIDGYIYPELDTTFKITKSTENLFKAVAHLSKVSAAPHILMVGPQGCGKTETASQFAARLNLPLLKINCTLVREPRDWFGSKTVQKGDVEWVKSQFVEAVSNGNVVILLDELTRATPSVLNSLLPLLDHTRQAFLEEVKEVLHVGPNVFFFATANIGSKFTGTFGKIDSALSDRFAIRIPVTYLKHKDEAQLLVDREGLDAETASKLASLAVKIREQNDISGTLTETVSTRNLLSAAKLYKLIGRDALDTTIVSLFSDKGNRDSEQAQVLQIIQGIGL